MLYLYQVCTLGPVHMCTNLLNQFSYVINHTVLFLSKHYTSVMRITAVYGSLATLNSTMEEWTKYIEKLQFYRATNGITAAAKQ